MLDAKNFLHEKIPGHSFQPVLRNCELFSAQWTWHLFSGKFVLAPALDTLQAICVDTRQNWWICEYVGTDWTNSHISQLFQHRCHCRWTVREVSNYRTKRTKHNIYKLMRRLTIESTHLSKMGVAMPKFLDVKLYLLSNLRRLLGPWPRPLFEKNLRVICRLSKGTCLPNLKSVALTVLE